MKHRRCLTLSTLALAFAWILPSVADDSADVNLVVADGHVDFLAGSVLVGRYHLSPQESSEAKPYFWPLNGPGGVPITPPGRWKRESPANRKIIHTKSPCGLVMATSFPKASSWQTMSMACRGWTSGRRGRGVAAFSARS